MNKTIIARLVREGRLAEALWLILDEADAVTPEKLQSILNKLDTVLSLEIEKRKSNTTKLTHLLEELQRARYYYLEKLREIQKEAEMAKQRCLQIIDLIDRKLREIQKIATHGTENRNNLSPRDRKHRDRK